MNNRCKKCNSKNSFMLECKCKNSYCVKHLLPEIHECSELWKFKKDAYDKNKKSLLDASQKEKVEWIN
jgi:predicted nucleic acid binding AN1-type Zn finger protein